MNLELIFLLNLFVFSKTFRYYNYEKLIEIIL